MTLTPLPRDVPGDVFDIFTRIEALAHVGGNPAKGYSREAHGRGRTIGSNQYAGALVLSDSQTGPAHPVLVWVQHHNTRIVQANRAGVLTIDNGGWYSMTTRGNIEAFLPKPLRLFGSVENRRSKHEPRWYVALDSGPFPRIVEFAGGMELHQDHNGRWQSTTPETDANQAIRIRQAAESWARTYHHHELGDCGQCGGRIHPQHFVIDHAEMRYYWKQTGPRYDRALVRQALLAQNIIAPPDMLAERIVRRALREFVKVHDLPVSVVLAGKPSDPTPCA
jgi:hypothetical protein